MSSEATILSLLEKALDLEGDALRAFLDQLAAENPEAHAELEAMLADDPDEGTGLLGRPLGQVFADLVADDPAMNLGGGLVHQHPESIGPFRVLSLLGEGGMGSVYLAEQSEPVKRQVAIKLIRAGLVGADARARFEIERQAMARLEHPAIASMYEAGTTSDGFPYFVMEWVDGEPLVQFCDREELDTHERLRLFVEICRGVEHAHRKGILHRDLKPSNLLVSRLDGVPHPKIIDFGIAKAVDGPLADGTALTRFGVGTPAYMSPEALGIEVGEKRRSEAAGPGEKSVGQTPGFDVDTRTDVYGLGMVLYQLLVGVLPFDAEALRLEQLMEKIGSANLPSLVSRFRGLGNEERERIAAYRHQTVQGLGRHLRGELEWITARALEADKQRRYGSPAELADEIGRFLRQEPIAAGPPSLRYRAGRFVDRHRGPVTAAALALLLLVLGTVGTTIGMLRARSEAARASQEIEKTHQAVLDAEETTRFLVELFEVSDPREAGGHGTTARELLARGAENLEERLADQPLRRARQQHTLGKIYARRGMLPEARHHAGLALDLRRQLLGPNHPDSLETRELLQSLEESEASVVAPPNGEP